MMSWAVGVVKNIYLNTLSRSLTICLHRNLSRYARVVNTHYSGEREKEKEREREGGGGGGEGERES